MSMFEEAARAEDLAEIVFELSEAEMLDGARTETLWAVAEGGGFFRLAATPFHVTGVSSGDLIIATPLPGGDARYIFSRVVEKSGRSTFRVLTYPDTAPADFLASWRQLEAVGCACENQHDGLPELHAIDVPPEADIERVLVLLRAAQVAGVWDFEQGDCGHMR